MKLVNAPKKSDPPDEPELQLDPLDPLSINPRLQQWVSELIEAREDMSIGEQIRAIAAIARLQVNYIALRKEAGGGYATGTEVKRFAKAFAKNAIRGRQSNTRALTHDDDPELDEE
jgi:hypothetical protein